MLRASTRISFPWDQFNIWPHIPLLANEGTFRFSSCIAGSSDIGSPFRSKRFQQSQWGHRNERGSRGAGVTAELQKKQMIVLCRLKIVDIRACDRKDNTERERERKNRMMETVEDESSISE